MPTYAEALIAIGYAESARIQSDARRAEAQALQDSLNYSSFVDQWTDYANVVGEPDKSSILADLEALRVLRDEYGDKYIAAAQWHSTGFTPLGMAYTFMWMNQFALAVQMAFSAQGIFEEAKDKADECYSKAEAMQNKMNDMVSEYE